MYGNIAPHDDNKLTCCAPLSHTSKAPAMGACNTLPTKLKPAETLHPADESASSVVNISGPLRVQNVATGMENLSTAWGKGPGETDDGTPAKRRSLGPLRVKSVDGPLPESVVVPSGRT